MLDFENQVIDNFPTDYLGDFVIGRDGCGNTCISFYGWLYVKLVFGISFNSRRVWII